MTGNSRKQQGRIRAISTEGNRLLAERAVDFALKNRKRYTKQCKTDGCDSLVTGQRNWCRECLSKRKRSEETPPIAKSRTRGCWIYFIGASNEKGLVKIGASFYVEQRLKTLQTGCPVALSIWAALRVDQPSREIVFHAAFSDQRRHGEWFKVDRRLRKLIKAVKDKDLAAISRFDFIGTGWYVSG